MRSLLLLLLLTAGTATALTAQTSPCLPADGHATSLINTVTDLVTSTDPDVTNLRGVLGLNNVNTSQITLITSGTDCTKAKQALDALAKTPNSNRRMYVVKAGNKRFIVRDPADNTFYVFDNKWVFVKAVY